MEKERERERERGGRGREMKREEVGWRGREGECRVERERCTQVSTEISNL